MQALLEAQSVGKEGVLLLLEGDLSPQTNHYIKVGRHVFCLGFLKLFRVGKKLLLQQPPCAVYNFCQVVLNCIKLPEALGRPGGGQFG